MIKNNSLIFGSTGFIGTKVVSHLKNFEGSTITISRKKNPDFGSLVDQIIVEDFKRGDIYKKILETFPDAEMVDLKIKEDDNE